MYRSLARFPRANPGLKEANDRQTKGAAMKILFDSQSVQVQQQELSKTRLNTLLGAIQSAGTSLGAPWTVTLSTDPITPEQLADTQVLVILTRNQSNPYTSGELSAIYDFVSSGGGLLLMSNHPPFMESDQALAIRFGVTLSPIFISNPTRQHVAVNPMFMSGIASLNSALSGDILFEVETLVSHDSCGIVPPASFTSIATFPPTAVVSSGTPPPSPFFAIAVACGSGNVIIVGNSGIVCDNGNTTPSCGLVPYGNNLMFFLNCLRFLNQQAQPVPGFCPGCPPPS
jgi:hypothetical protein